MISACSEYKIAECLELVPRRDPGIEIPEQVIVDCLKTWGGDVRSDVANILEKAERKIAFTPTIRDTIENELQDLSERKVREKWSRLEQIES